MRKMSVQATVFSREGCVQCNATFRALDARGVQYHVVDVDELPTGAADELRALGFQQLPVVKAERMAAWSGFRPDLIGAIESSRREGLEQLRGMRSTTGSRELCGDRMRTVGECGQYATPSAVGHEQIGPRDQVVERQHRGGPSVGGNREGQRILPTHTGGRDDERVDVGECPSMLIRSWLKPFLPTSRGNVAGRFCSSKSGAARQGPRSLIGHRVLVRRARLSA